MCPANRQDRLELPVAALLGRAAGRIALDNIQLGVRGIAIGAIRQLARQPATGERGFSHRFPCLARRLPGTRRVQPLVHHLLRHRRIGVQMRHQAVVSDRTDDAFDFRRQQFFFWLVVELGVRVFDRNHRHQTFQQIVAGHLRVFVFEQVVLFGVLIDRPRQGRPESGLVRATVRVVHRVGVTQDLGAVAVVVLNHHIRDDVGLPSGSVLGVFVRAPSAESDGLGMQDLLALAQLLDKLRNAVLVVKRFPLGLGDPFVEETDLQT